MDDELTISRDWDNRHFVKTLQYNVVGLVDFLNKFDISTRVKLSEVSNRLKNLERNVDFLEAVVGLADDDAAGPSSPDADTPMGKMDVEIQVLSPGDGSTYAHLEGGVVTLSYTGYLASTGEILEQFTPEQPNLVFLGTNTVISGLERAISMLSLGEQARVTIPPSMAYGEEGVIGRVPANETLIYDLFIAQIE